MTTPLTDSPIGWNSAGGLRSWCGLPGTTRGGRAAATAQPKAGHGGKSAVRA